MYTEAAQQPLKLVNKCAKSVLNNISHNNTLTLCQIFLSLLVPKQMVKEAQTMRKLLSSNYDQTIKVSNHEQ